MTEITLEGVVCSISYHTTKHVVFIDEKDHKKLHVWWQDNSIQTDLQKKYHPILHTRCPQISAQTTAKNIREGTRVKITIDASTRMRGGMPHIGIKTVSIIPIDVI
jgi:hypothetical protein